jgi:hypothetical protein
LRKVNLNAAGIDVGATEHYVAVPKGRDEDTVRSFGTFTADLEALADWLQECGIETVAMESTGVYWIPVFELLESRGLDGRLAEAPRGRGKGNRMLAGGHYRQEQCLHQRVETSRKRRTLSAISATFRAIAESKFSDVGDFGRNRTGRMMLTDHGSEVWYRNIQFKLLPMGDVVPAASTSTGADE